MGFIKLECYDPAWERRFTDEAATLRSAFGTLARRIEHVGSTAVPGLIAKPVIDIQVSVISLASLEPFVVVMRELGYAHLPDPDPIFERSYPYFHKPVVWPHSHHVHLCEEGGVLEQRHLLFRDCLRASASVREQYAALKRELARAHQGKTHDERQRYSDGKTDFVRAVVEAACEPEEGE